MVASLVSNAVYSMIDFVVAAVHLDDLTCCAVFVPKFVLSQQMKRDYIGQLQAQHIEAEEVWP